MLWMAVTADRYELPICVESTAERLASKMHTSESNIRTKKHRNADGSRRGYKVVTVNDKE